MLRLILSRTLLALLALPLLLIYLVGGILAGLVHASLLWRLEMLEVWRHRKLGPF